MSFAGDQYAQFASKVITTRGDIIRGNSSGARERLGVGSANQVLQSDGTDADWSTLSLAGSTLTTQGDVLYQNASGLARLGQSTDGHVLTTKGAAANPVWAAVSGGANTNRILISGATNAQTTTSTALIDLTGTTSASLSNQTGGSAWIFYSFVKETSSIGASVIAIGIDGTDTSLTKDQSAPSNYITTVSGCAACVATSGQTIQQRVATGSGTMTIYNLISNYGQTLTNIMEVW